MFHVGILPCVVDNDILGLVKPTQCWWFLHWPLYVNNAVKHATELAFCQTLTGNVDLSVYGKEVTIDKYL